jgi:hypothetical protein
MHELRTWMDGALAKTPGFSSLLPAKRDIFGEKIQAQPGFPQSAFNPFPVTKSNNDPVTRETGATRTVGCTVQLLDAE